MKLVIKVLIILSISTGLGSCEKLDMIQNFAKKMFKKKPNSSFRYTSNNPYTALDVPTAGEVNGYLNSAFSPKERCLQLSADPNIPVKLPNPKIKPLGKGRYWSEDYNNMILENYKHPDLQELLYMPIDKRDLNAIGCPGYTYATPHEKGKFHMVMLAAIDSQESKFDPSLSFTETNGTISRGLLQIDHQAAIDSGCKSKPFSPISPRGMHKTPTSIRCGMYIYRNQLRGGAKFRNGPSRGRLFPDDYYYWNVVTSHKKRGVKQFFMAHKSQLPFCQRTKASQTLGVKGPMCDSSTMTEEELHDCLSLSRLGERRNSAADRFARCTGIDNSSKFRREKENPIDNHIESIEKGDYLGITRG